jgi:hypothetical protein
LAIEDHVAHHTIRLRELACNMSFITEAFGRDPALNAGAGR